MKFGALETSLQSVSQHLEAKSANRSRKIDSSTSVKARRELWRSKKRRWKAKGREGESKEKRKYRSRWRRAAAINPALTQSGRRRGGNSLRNDKSVNFLINSAVLSDGLRIWMIQEPRDFFLQILKEAYEFVMQCVRRNANKSTQTRCGDALMMTGSTHR